MGTKEKKRKEGDLYTKQCAGSAPGVPTTLSRTPAQGAPPNHTRPPHSGCSTGPSSAQLLCKPPPLSPLGAHTPHPKTTIRLVPVAGRRGSFWGKGASVFMPLLRGALPIRAKIRGGNLRLLTPYGSRSWHPELSPPQPGRHIGLRPQKRKHITQDPCQWPRLSCSPGLRPYRPAELRSEMPSIMAVAGYEPALLLASPCPTRHVNTFSSTHPAT